ncbi:MAG: hypothetical protein FWF46_06275 [Oscillospiraceae bacterium]|nr:hypothetical protein [Oscillospiraceae bacterium]
MIVCLEGANCVGKTTILNLLKEKFSNAIIIDDFIINDYLNKENDYLQARINIQKDYDLFNKNKLFIVVRWQISMYVFDFFNEDDFNDGLNKLVIPDYTVIIDSNKFIIKYRLRKRKDFIINMDILKQLKRYRLSAKKFNYEIYKNNIKHDQKRIIKSISDNIRKNLHNS